MPSSDYHVNEPVPGSFPVALGGDNTLQNEGYIFITAARTTTGGDAGSAVYSSPEMYNPNARGVRLYCVVANGGGTVTIKLQVRDPYTDVWVDLPGATTAALNNTAGTLMTVYPGLTGIADTGTNVNQHLGTSWRCVATVGAATETFSVGAEYLL
jgi:hypothetical protein